MIANTDKGWIGLLPILLLSACATQNAAQAPANAVHCSDPRPQICTMDYTPVCATRDSSETATYANACGACSDSRVMYHVAGACSE
ncbi:MAG: hypothetical protein OEU50_12065 [Gammaproteobacteria bacterium]|nr:hypothetical protein [Gammaproteobacteria bacterium]